MRLAGGWRWHPHHLLSVPLGRPRLGWEGVRDLRERNGWTIGVRPDAKVTAMPKRPRDLNSLAASLVDDATREGPVEPAPENPDDARRVRENGRLGGLKGGRARADKLSAEQRSEIARKAARVRWASSRLS
jgi:hypothetical protein